MRWEMCTLTESLLTGSFRPLAALGDGWGGSLHSHRQGPRGPCVPTCVMGDLGVFSSTSAGSWAKRLPERGAVPSCVESDTPQLTPWF